MAAIAGPTVPMAGRFSDQTSETLVMSTSQAKILPKTGTEYVQNQYIRFEIPSADFLKSDNISLSFNVALFTDVAQTTTTAGFSNIRQWGVTPNVASAGGGAGALQQIPFSITPVPNLPNIVTDFYGVRLSNSVHSIFQRVRLLHGSTPLEDIFEWNVLDKILKLRKTATLSEQLLIKEGYGAVSDPKTYASLVEFAAETDEDYDWRGPASTAPNYAVGGKKLGHEYEISVSEIFGFFRTGKWLPLEEMQTLAIEFYMAPNVSACVSPVLTADIAAAGVGQPTPAYPDLNYKVTNPYLHFTTLKPSREYVNSVKAKIASEGGLQIPYATWYNHINQIQGMGRQTLTIQERAKSVRAMVSVMRNNNTIGSLTNDQGLFTSQGLTQLQWQVGSNYFPLQPIENVNGGVEMYQQTLEWLGYQNSTQKNAMLTLNDYSRYSLKPIQHADTNPFYHVNHMNLGNQFFMVLDLEKSAGQISGYNTVDDVVDLQILMTLSPRNWAFQAPNSTTVVPLSNALVSNWVISAPLKTQGATLCLLGRGNEMNGYPISSSGYLSNAALDNTALTLSKFAINNPPATVRIDSFCWVDQIFSLTAPLQAVIKR